MIFRRSGDDSVDEGSGPVPKGIQVGGRVWSAGESSPSSRDDADSAARARQQAAIAQDLNNLLVSLIGHARLALSEVPPDSPAYERVKQLEASATHAARLAADLLRTHS